KTVDAEDEAEPVLAALAEARPGDGAAQDEGVALQAALLADLAADAGDDVLAGLELAAEAVVLALVGVVGAAVAVDQQHARAVRARKSAPSAAERQARVGREGRRAHGLRPADDRPAAPRVEVVQHRLPEAPIDAARQRRAVGRPQQRPGTAALLGPVQRLAG